jgi:ADP-glucose pyrophosphorylase
VLETLAHRRPDRVARLAGEECAALILAGGRGSRLRELTNWRAKPSLPFGGKFRIIDFVLSNCVNSGIRRIGICTQYKAQSLIRHVQRGWSFLDGRFNEFIELLPANNGSRRRGIRARRTRSTRISTSCAATIRRSC